MSKKIKNVSQYVVVPAHVVKLRKELIEKLKWGEKLPYVSHYPRVLLPQEFPFDNFEQIIKEEFSPWGGIRYKEPGIKVTYEDQVRDLILKYKTYKLIDIDKLYYF
jgi:alpha-galactosidase